MHEDNAERFPGRVEKYAFLHISMYFCTSQIDDISMNDVTSMHVWEISSCPGWNLMMSPRVLIVSTSGITAPGTFD